MRTTISRTMASTLLVAANIAAEPIRPNILFILADDLGWDDPKCLPEGSIEPAAGKNACPWPQQIKP
jgi:hypothetical protein